MAEAQLQQFLDKVRQLNAFVALSEADPALRRTLRDCEHHDEVVALARRCGFEIGRRWGEAPGVGPAPAATTDESGATATTGEALATGATGEILATIATFATGATITPGAIGASGETIASGTGSSAIGANGATSRIVPLLAGDCPVAGQEHSALLLQRPQLRLERIHSCQAVSPPGFWYDQTEAEWLLLLQGTARLQFADEATERCLQPGDSLWIEAHRRHRVTATDPAPGTIWLALFWRESGSGPGPGLPQSRG